VICFLKSHGSSLKDIDANKEVVAD